MDWFRVIMTGLQMAPGIISHFKGTAASNATKQAKTLDYVITGMQTFSTVDPQHAAQVLGNPKVQDAVRAANDWIYFAGKVADAVAKGQEPPPPPAPAPQVLPADVPGV